MHAMLTAVSSFASQHHGVKPRQFAFEMQNFQLASCLQKSRLFEGAQSHSEEEACCCNRTGTFETQQHTPSVEGVSKMVLVTT